VIDAESKEGGASRLEVDDAGADAVPREAPWALMGRLCSGVRSSWLVCIATAMIC
jgi:hypothetical protein